jgi:GNAT superfamily N-acetyltransferase
MSIRIDVGEGTIAEAFSTFLGIPEFVHEGAASEFERRLSRASALVLIARAGDRAVGFKAGYDRYLDGSWYSWLGGVTPQFRGRGVARALLAAQEAWVRERGFRRIYVKTRNRYVDMRVLLARSGYQVVGCFPAASANDPATAIAESRILHVKDFT